jgi:HD-GYP domain-containing protein (c-di-GMP phosphodiesterase class II)
MNKSAHYSLVLTSAFILAFNAQVMLLSPHLAQALIGNRPALFTDILAGIYFLASILLFGSNLLSFSGRRRALVYTLGALALETLAALYFRADLPIEAVLLASLGLTYPLALFSKSPSKLQSDHWLLHTVLLVNVAAVIALWLPAQMKFIQGTYALENTGRYVLGGAFLLSAIVGIYAAFNKSISAAVQGQIGALPWLLWTTIFVNHWNTPGMIVSLSLAANLIWIDAIPWNRIVLPEEDQLGRRLYRSAALLTGLLLILLTGLTRIAADHLQSAYVAHQISDLALIIFSGITVIGINGTLTVALGINGVLAGLRGDPVTFDKPEGIWSGFFFEWLEPFNISWQAMRAQAEQHEERVRALNTQLVGEKRRIAQLGLLNDLNRELENVLDPPVSAQMAARSIYSALDPALCVIYSYEPDKNEFIALASAGVYANTLPPDYRHSGTRGLIGRAARLRRSQLASDTRLDPENFQSDHPAFLSQLVIPLLHNGQLKGVIVLDDERTNAFDEGDIRTLEGVAIQLTASWERSVYDQRLAALIESGATLSTALDIEAVITQTAAIAQETLDARFVFIALADKGGGFTRSAHAGYAPTLQGLLSRDPGGNALVQTAMNSSQAFRMRDVRKRFAATIPTGGTDTRCMLALPIRVKRQSVGALLAFGKHGDVTFSESDEALATLLATQSAAAVETTWLYQELRSTLTTATLLYELSTRVIQAEELTDAAAAVAEIAQKLSGATSAGIVLFALDGKVEAQVAIDSSGIHPGANHPMELIAQAMESGQNIIVSGERDSAKVCLLLRTPHRQYGSLWLEIPESHWYNARYESNVHTLANQAALALERGILLTETRWQARQLAEAYQELEITYDQTLAALSSALDARDRETEGHSLRVARLAALLGQKLGLTAEQAKLLERGSILHDIGKIGISDTILLKPGPLTEDEWQLMRQHPDIGARIIEGIPFLLEALPVIRYHQERWNGSGYPIGLKEHEIPLLARIFAVADTFDALTSTRPYRKKISIAEALDYVKKQAGILFDPQVVKVMATLLREGRVAQGRPPHER